MYFLKWHTLPLRFYFCHYLTVNSMETDRNRGRERCMTYDKGPPTGVKPETLMHLNHLVTRMIPPSHTFDQKPRRSVLFIQSWIIWIFHVYSVKCYDPFFLWIAFPNVKVYTVFQSLLDAEACLYFLFCWLKSYQISGV